MSNKKHNSPGKLNQSFVKHHIYIYDYVHNCPMRTQFGVHIGTQSFRCILSMGRLTKPDPGSSAINWAPHAVHVHQESQKIDMKRRKLMAMDTMYKVF